MCPEGGSRSRRAAIVALFDDPSAHVWRALRRELAAQGKGALPLLTEISRRSPSARARTRARGLLAARDRRIVERRLVRLACRSRFDLERALFLLAKLHSPDLDPRPYSRVLDIFARRVRRAAGKDGGAVALRDALCRVLGEELAFGGALADYHHPENLHLHRVIERRAGLPLSVCAVYLFVARRLGLHAALLPLPGHVMLRVGTGDEALIVDPFHFGRPRSERECRAYIAEHGLTFRPEWLRDADDRSMFQRQLANLARSYEERGLVTELRGLRTVMRAMHDTDRREPRPRAHRA